MGSASRTRMMYVSLAALLLLTSVIPAVTGDGMPAYQIVDINDPDHPELFKSTFESRQLARIDLVNSSHERISLFLSVYSMDPGKNLTIMVPLRTLPVDVTGEPMKETEFRSEYLLDRAEREVLEQDPDEAWGKFRDKTSSALQMCFGSMVWTLPAEYSRQSFHLAQGNGEGKDSLGAGSDAVIEEPEPVQHYEFDGFSIDVYGVDAGGILGDYLATKGLIIPEGGGLERYEGQYVAVIEAESKPPIDDQDYETFRTACPNTTAYLIDRLRESPVMTEYERRELKRDLIDELNNEVDYDQDRELRRECSRILEDLVDALFGSTDFEGEVLSVDLPLDNGKVFFPLGTSAGWPNQVGDIDVLFRVPEDKDLKVASSKDAFFEGYHWYLFQMELANPDFDLEGDVVEGDEDRRTEAARAQWVYNNSWWVSYLIALLVVVALWALLALLFRRYMSMEGRAVRNPLLWGLMGLSLLISVPGALFVYFMYRPLPGKEVISRPETTAAIAIYPLAMFVLALTVVLS